MAYFTCFTGILIRELLRFWQQRSRLISALVRPLLWLVVFAAANNDRQPMWMPRLL